MSRLKICVLLTGFSLLGIIALFPPVRANNKHSSLQRGFLFGSGYSVSFPPSKGHGSWTPEINTGRLLAEALLIVAVTGGLATLPDDPRRK